MISIKSIFNLFFPKSCLACHGILLEYEKICCTECMNHLPKRKIKNFYSNDLFNILYGKVKIEKFNSLFVFEKKGPIQNLIHNLKYHGHQEIGEFIYNFTIEDLERGNFFEDIDLIIPIPLHPNKRKKRGYNQLTTWGEKISKHTKIPYCRNILFKAKKQTSQTLKEKIGRWKNTKESFTCKNKEMIENKHILLIDDVITTGATIEASCRALQKEANLKISVLTIASPLVI